MIELANHWQSVAVVINAPRICFPSVLVSYHQSEELPPFVLLHLVHSLGSSSQPEHQVQNHSHLHHCLLSHLENSRYIRVNAGVYNHSSLEITSNSDLCYLGKPLQSLLPPTEQREFQNHNLHPPWPGQKANNYHHMNNQRAQQLGMTDIQLPLAFLLRLNRMTMAGLPLELDTDVQILK